MDDDLLEFLAYSLHSKPRQIARDLADAATAVLGRPITRSGVNRILYGTPSIFQHGDEVVPRWSIGASPKHAELAPIAPAHVLHTLTVAGWKSFGHEESVTLAPITLLVGQNSAGKSSVIQALLTLKQSVQMSTGTVPRLLLNGPLAEVGSFSSVVYGHNTDHRVQIGLSFVDPVVGFANKVFLPNDAERRVDFEWEWDAISASVQLRQCRLAVGQMPPIRFERLHEHTGEWAPQGGDDRTSRYEVHEHDFEAFATLVSAVNSLAEISRDDPEGTPSFAHLLRTGFQPSFDDAQFVPGHIQGLANPASGEVASDVRFGGWNNWTANLRREFGSVLERLVYLGPLRQPLERVSTLLGPSSDQVGSTGENTAEILASDPTLSAEVSDWFGRLGIPYKLVVTGIGDERVRRAVGEVATVLLQSTEDVTAEPQDAVLVHPAAVGFGVGQVMPIVVQCLLSKNKIICIEQPEVHLHPRLQSTLADLFVHSMEANHNQFIIETHSEHLLLRLQRRIGEGSLVAENLRVLYVESAAGGASVATFTPQADGDLPPEWPAGFFADRLSEMLAR